MLLIFFLPEGVLGLLGKVVRLKTEGRRDKEGV